MEEIVKSICKEVQEKTTPKRMKIKSLLRLFSYKKRSEYNTTLITELLNDNGLQINPSLMKLGDIWEQSMEDWVYISEKKNKKVETTSKEEINLPENWNNDGWFDNLSQKSFRTEKEVETKFILPLLSKLGYGEDDRYDAMPVSAAHGSRKTTLEIDFAMFDEETEELKNQVLLVVEAKKEHRLIKKAELEKAQRQTKSYSIWLGCHYGLVTDSRTIQVLDLMPTIGGIDVLFECERENLKDNFSELYRIISKRNLKKYYLEIIL